MSLVDTPRHTVLPGLGLYDELISRLALMLVGGNETSRKLVGNAIVALDAHPDQLQRLRREPELMAGAIEEFIR
jgi:cytochrome P450